jgi:hypothetical protein
VEEHRIAAGNRHQLDTAANDAASKRRKVPRAADRWISTVTVGPITTVQSLSIALCVIPARWN